MKDLIVIIPAYNEEDIIHFVIKDWISNLRLLNINFQLNVYDDGSPDSTFDILNELSKEFEELNPISKPNSGHGPTILYGYKDAVNQAEWIFQVDSDNEMSAKFFENLWNFKNDYDFLIGLRDNRQQPFSRKAISAISRIIVGLFYGNKVKDVNSPYRLMNSAKFESLFSKIPKYTFAPNLIVSGYASRKKFRIFQYPIPHKDRETGEVSIKKWKLFKAAFKSMVQTVKFSFFLNRKDNK